MESVVSQPSASAPTGSNQKKVHSACQRCRQQKLKCDVYRPCTLCVRAGAICSAADKSTTWKKYRPGQGLKPIRNREIHTDLPKAKRSRRASSAEYVTSVPSVPANEGETTRGERLPSLQAADSSWVPSSAAMKFMKEAFHQHQTNSPDGPETSAFSASNWTQGDKIGTAESEDEPMAGGTQRQKQPHDLEHDVGHKTASHRETNSPGEAELLSLLPPIEAATILVDNYFDRVHWFLLVFHQSDFREQFKQLYEDLLQHLRRPNVGLGFLGVFSAVCIVSLRYIDTGQTTRLSECGIRPDVLQLQLLTALRLSLLEIVSRGSIEAVQVCVLLGSFYLYHGEPELAWPICGSGLRIAQALNLHRRRPHRGPRPPDLDDPHQRAEETRKRCWWAVYEIETFCSMLYGFPLSISDDDCDVELLNPYPLRSRHVPWDRSAWQQTGQATLLSYKHAMAQLSVIIKSVLKNLYGIRGGLVSTNDNSSAADRRRLQKLTAAVFSLDRELHGWYMKLPWQLRPDDTTGANEEARERPNLGDVESPEERFRHHLFQLQALALRISFENARILIHRPLLSYRMITSPDTNITKSPLSSASIASDTCQSSLQICRHAALQISKAGSLPIFHVVADTYAVSFVSLHLLTAAITLSILATLTPLSQESYESKMGIRRLMEMQSRLKARSIIAQQGLGILKKLMSLVLSKEAAEMLDLPTTSGESEQDVGTFGAQRVRDTVGKSQCQTHNDIGQLDQGDSAPMEQNSMDAMLLSVSDSDLTGNSSFSFYEDPIITQALLDFDQVVNYTHSESNQGMPPSANPEFSTGSCFGIQDQGWIWGSSHYL